MKKRDVFSVHCFYVESEESIDNQYTTATYYSESKAIAAAKKCLREYADWDEVIEAVVFAGEYETERGIFGEPFDIWTGTNVDEGRSSEARSKMGFAKTNGLDMYGKSRRVKDSQNNWSLWTYDVWGNEEDGFEVNNKFEVDNHIDIDYDNVTDEEILSILKRYGVVDNDTTLDDIEIEYNESDLIFVNELIPYTPEDENDENFGNELIATKPLCEFLDNNAWGYAD